MTSKFSQIIYVLTNPAMHGLVKIGKTTQLEVDERMKQLYSTGVPVPFDCAFACQVKDAHEVEKALHFAFGNTRINPNREFFKIEADRVISVLKLLKVDDITAQFEHKLEADIEAVDKQSAQQLKDTKRPRMDFYELGITQGSILVSKDGSLQVKVVEPKKVELNGEVCSLTEATRKLLNLAEGYPIQPSPYWTFNGKTVKEIYEEYHSDIEEI
jgi:T5orf172 domain